MIKCVRIILDIRCPQKLTNLEVRKIWEQEDIMVRLTRRKWARIGHENPATLLKKVYSGHQKGKDNGEGLQQPERGQRKKNSRPYSWPGVKSGGGLKIVRAGKGLSRSYASDGAMRTDDDDDIYLKKKQCSQCPDRKKRILFLFKSH